jgi:Plavaka transposase
MSWIVEPLETAGTDGLSMASGDGIVHQTHPIFAVYVGDYPEQLLVTGVKNGECPLVLYHVIVLEMVEIKIIVTLIQF